MPQSLSAGRPAVQRQTARTHKAAALKPQ